MKYKLLILFFIFLRQVSLSQNQIKFNNPKIGIGAVNEIFFSSEKIGYGIGDFNKFCKTTDGGVTWNLIDTSPIGKSFSNFSSIFFLNDSLGFLASKDGKVFKTIDGGLNLTELNEFNVTPYETPYLHFFSEQKGIIKWYNSPDLLYTTDDGGLTWQNKPNDPDYFDNCLFSYNENLLFSNNGSDIYKSTDFAENWRKIGNVPYDGIFSIQFINEMDGFIYGFERTQIGTKYYISKTQDGGTTWETNMIYQDKFKQLEKVYFVNLIKGFGIDDSSGAVFETSDGGTSWAEVKYRIPSFGVLPIRDIFFISNQTGFMVSDYGLFLSTEDGGNNWVVNYESIIFSNLNSITYIDQEKLIIVGNNGSCLIKNNSIIEDVTVPTTENLSSVAFSNSQDGVIVGKNGSVFLSTNGGTIWNKIKESSYSFNHVIFNGSKGLICGNDGIILKSEDNGNSWIDLTYEYTDLDIPYHFTSSEILDQGELLLLGYAEKYNGFDFDYYTIVLKSIDNGNTWSEQILRKSYYYSEPFNVKRISSEIVLLSSYEGCFKSTDAGDTWKEIDTDYNRIISIINTDDNEVYGISNSGLIKSIDAGDTWSYIRSFDSLVQSGTILDFAFTQTDSCYIGSKGLILSNNDFTPSVKQEPVIKTAEYFLSVSTDSLSLNSSANNSHTFDITSNINWSIESDQAWLTVTPSDGNQNGTIELTAAKNTETVPRTAIVTVSGVGVKNQLINVTQEDVVLNVANEINSEIRLYPNPIKDVLNIDSSIKTINITVFNLFGKVCIDRQVTNKQIDLSELVTGVYFIHISSYKENFIKTIIKR